MTVTLQDITKANWRQATKLTLKPGQERFVAPNLYSIAQRQFYPEVRAQAVFAGDTMVGFVMWGEDADDNPGELWVWRLMIDAAHQRKGYGRAVMMMLIAQARADGHDALFLSYEPENAGAAAFYAGLGFEETGRVEHGETVVKLDLRLE